MVPRSLSKVMAAQQHTGTSTRLVICGGQFAAPHQLLTAHAVGQKSNMPPAPLPTTSMSLAGGGPHAAAAATTLAATATGGRSRATAALAAALAAMAATEPDRPLGAEPVALTLMAVRGLGLGLEPPPPPPADVLWWCVWPCSCAWPCFCSCWRLAGEEEATPPVLLLALPAGPTAKLPVEAAVAVGLVLALGCCDDAAAIAAVAGGAAAMMMPAARAAVAKPLATVGARLRVTWSR